MAGYVAAKRAFSARAIRRDGALLTQTAIVGMDDAYSRESARASSRTTAPGAWCRSPACAASRAASTSSTGCCYDETDGATGPVLDVRTRARPARHAQLAERGRRLCRRARRRRLRRPTSRAAIETYPGLPHRQERVAEIERRTLRQRLQGDQRRRRRARARLLRGDLLDRRRQAEGRRARTRGRHGFRRIRHAYLIGEAAEQFAGELAGKVKSRRMRHAGAGGARGLADARKDERRRRRSCCCRPPAPRSTSSRISRRAATRSARARRQDRRKARNDDRLRPHRRPRSSAAGGGRSTAGRSPPWSLLAAFGVFMTLAASPAGRRAHRARLRSTSSAARSRCCCRRWR